MLNSRILLIAVLLCSCSAAQAQSSGPRLSPARSATLSSPVLPPTTLDSFVTNAGGQAEFIYGDEGLDGLPPFYKFSEEHRIGSAMSPMTTGHGSTMPSAWGGDEFVGAEWVNTNSGGYSGNTEPGIDLSGIMQAVYDLETLAATDPNFTAAQQAELDRLRSKYQEQMSAAEGQ